MPRGIPKTNLEKLKDQILQLSTNELEIISGYVGAVLDVRAADAKRKAHVEAPQQPLKPESTVNDHLGARPEGKASGV